MQNLLCSEGSEDEEALIVSLQVLSGIKAKSGRLKVPVVAGFAGGGHGRIN
jgi:hypothetical protein